MSKKHIVVIAGPPSSGKTSQAQPYVDKGYCRINRDQLDQAGRSPARTDECADLVAYLFDMGKETRFVLDNTYGTARQREFLLRVAKDRGIPVDFFVMQTTQEECRFLAARRMLQKYDKLMDDKEMEVFKSTEKEPSPDLFPPRVIPNWFKRYEYPQAAEGIRSVTPIPFSLELGPNYTNRAIILDYDSTLRATRVGDISINNLRGTVSLDERRDVLKRKQNEGFKILGVCDPLRSTDRDLGFTFEQHVEDCFKWTNRLPGFNIDHVHCAHRGNPTQCYCRKPGPGLGVQLIEKHKLDPSQCIYVGNRALDKNFAFHCGFNFEWADIFFR